MPYFLFQIAPAEMTVDDLGARYAHLTAADGGTYRGGILEKQGQIQTKKEQTERSTSNAIQGIVVSFGF